MIIIYPAVFTRTMDEKDTYVVEIPDIQGFTEGYGLADAINMAREYIGNYCSGLSDDRLPAPSSIDDIDINKCDLTETEKHHSFVSMIDLDLDVFRRKMNKRAVRRNVSIPAWLNQEAEKEHVNFSRVLQEALMQKLNLAKQ
jgi:predicted RNase H-like HicB family nuclease